VIRVGDQIAEAIVSRGAPSGRRAVRERMTELLSQVGITDPELRARQFPHELSGGMCQRVLIAIALAGNPSLLIADEPTSALDVTIQAQVLDLLARLRAERGMSILLITHDMGIAAQMADRVVVMYAGSVTEGGRAARPAAARHPRLGSRGGGAAARLPVPDAVPAQARRLRARSAAPAGGGRAARPHRAALRRLPSLGRAARRRAASMDRDHGRNRMTKTHVQPAVTPPPTPVVEVRDLVKSYRVRGGHGLTVRALDGVSLAVEGR
jgi:ABC-type glutathione transport system ATPase component